MVSLQPKWSSSSFCQTGLVSSADALVTGGAQNIEYPVLGYHEKCYSVKKHTP